jgi:serine/threonine protein kinase/TolB-like protein
VEVDAERIPDGYAVICPHCGARYRRRNRSSAPSESAVQTPGSRTSSGWGRTHRSVDQGAVSRGHESGIGGARGVARIARATASSSPSSGAGRGRGDRSFAPGDLVADRYLIVAFVAAGGMGEVYQVEDLELGGRLALKTVRRQQDDQGTHHALERFRREIQLARQVTHINVCRIFDVGFHPVDDGGPPITFLTMELLQGTTLSRRIANGGAMTAEQARPLVSDMCAGLAAIHAKGIIHRDFKCENVTIAATETGERAVVTDFGIARARHLDLDDASTRAGVLIGTPAYLAPEQVGGTEVTTVADIYSLGIVLYEMVTGRVPFRGETAIATAALRLTENPKSPCHYAPDLDSHWEAAILRCLERDPAKRFATVEELAAEIAPRELSIDQRVAVEKEKTEATKLERQRIEAVHAEQRAEEQAQSKKTDRLRIVLVSILMVLSLGFAAYRIYDRMQNDPYTTIFSPSEVHARKSLAVLGFRNTTERAEVAWLDVALTEMLATELGTSPELRLIPAERVATMRRELELDSLANPSEADLRRIGSYLSADYLLSGSFTSLPDGTLRVDARLRDAAGLESPLASAAAGAENALFTLVKDLSRELLQDLDVDAGARPVLASALPRDGRAAKLYAEGVERLRNLDPDGARTSLSQAASIEPNSAMIHAARAEALATLGLIADAADAARLAFELADDLPDRERLEISGAYGRYFQQWDRAIDSYLTLWRANPDTLEYGLKLATALIDAGRPGEALANVETLRRLPTGSDPRVDLVEARAAAATAQFELQLAAARRAIETATRIESRGLLAEAKLTESDALLQTGQSDAALASCREALYLYRELGQRQGEAIALGAYAAVRAATGGLQEAILLNEQARDIFEAIGDRGGLINALNNLGVSLRAHGDLAGARAQYEEAKQIAATTRDPLARHYALNNIGVLLIEEGSLDDAIASLEEALTTAREIGNRDGEASALGNLSAAHRELGDTQQADRLEREAQALRRTLGDRAGLLASLSQRGSLALLTGDLAAADRVFAELREGASEQQARPWMAQAARGASRVATLRGELSRAKELAEEALQLRRATSMRAGEVEEEIDLIALDLTADPAASAERLGVLLRDQESLLRSDQRARLYTLRARAARSAKDLAAAEDELLRAEDAMGENQRLQPRLELALERGQLALARGDRITAREVARSVLEQADAAGFVPVSLQARLLEADAQPTAAASAEVRARVEGEIRALSLLGLLGLDVSPEKVLGDAAPENPTALESPATP